MKNINTLKMMTKTAAVLIAAAFIILPLVTSAAQSVVFPQVSSSVTTGAVSGGSSASAPSGGFFAIINTIKSLINEVMPVVVSLAVLYLIWGIFQLVRSNDEKAHEAATMMITYGVIFLFVMVSVWGLVNILGHTLNLDQSTPKLPQIPGY